MNKKFFRAVMGLFFISLLIVENKSFSQTTEPFSVTAAISPTNTTSSNNAQGNAGQVYSQPSVVKIVGGKLIVQKRLPDGTLGNLSPYVIHGVTWSPATRAPESGPDPLNTKINVPYGFFFDDTWRTLSQGHEVMNYWLKNQLIEHSTNDIILMKRMNVNTVRIYNSLGSSNENYDQVAKDILPVLDQFYQNGVMVIMTVAMSKDDLDSKKYNKVVDAYKNHPAILMWSLGNEWNLGYNLYYGYKSVAEAAAATNQAAQEIKKLDKNHPVSSCLGDRFVDPDPSSTISYILGKCQDVDLWGLNIYRSTDFKDGQGNYLFNQWSSIASGKPFYFSEFGTDSYRTTDYKGKNNTPKLPDGSQAAVLSGALDELMQRDFDMRLWEETKQHLSFYYANELCLGGLIHEFNDELWKVGNYNAGLGGLVNYNTDNQSYKSYNSDGFVLAAHPDGVANEEYFGVVSADRKPKLAYYELQDIYSSLDIPKHVENRGLPVVTKPAPVGPKPPPVKFIPYPKGQK